MATTRHPLRKAVISDPVPPWHTTMSASVSSSWIRSKGRVSTASTPAGRLPPSPVWMITSSGMSPRAFSSATERTRRSKGRVAPTVANSSGFLGGACTSSIRKGSNTFACGK